MPYLINQCSVVWNSMHYLRGTNAHLIKNIPQHHAIYPFDGHNVLKRTKISTSEKPTIPHGGTSDTFKTDTKIRCLNSHSDFSVYLGECSHLQPLWSKLFVRIKTHWLFNKLKMELISSNGKTRWYTFWLWWYKRCTVREPMRF